MIRIDILSATPELLESPFSGSILRRAIEKNIVEVYFHNLRDYSTDKHHKIDDYINGGWTEYDQNISDHRPVGMKINFNYEFSFDLNNDGLVDDNDVTMLISIIFGQNNNQFLGDINLDSKVDIFDLLYLSDHLYD